MDDYKIEMRDSTGRTCNLFINGDSVSEYMADGYSEDDAREVVESNSFVKAIEAGKIGPDAVRVA